MPVGGRRLSDLVWHEVAGDGPPLVLVHEGIGDARMWDAQWRTFPQQHRTVRLDLRGFGNTPMATQPYSFPADVIAVIEGLGLGPVDLVGASMGGLVSIEVVLARPDLVRRLVLLAPPLPDHEHSAQMRAYGEAENAAAEAGDREAYTEINLRQWVDGPHRGPDEVDPAVREAVAEMQRRAFDLQTAGDEPEEYELVEDLTGRLGEIALPVLVLVGDLDVPDHVAIAERLARELPDARLETIPDAAHAAMMERPDVFDRLVLDFLGS